MFFQDLSLIKMKKSKLSTEQISQLTNDEMRDGQYYFLPEYLQTSQIRNLTTRFKKEHFSHHNKTFATSEEDGIVANLEEICV